MNELTKIEKWFAAKYPSEGNLPAFSPDIIRNDMKRVAYHEAGHFAAQCFMQYDFSHILEISIIGNGKNAGYVRSERIYTESSLKLYPLQVRQPHGYMLLLQKLAGFGAETILDQSDGWESLFDYYDNIYWVDDIYDEEGTDFYSALRIAEILARPYMPVNRIINLADKWTLEMLRIPAVWNVVETVADKLIKQGKIKRNACHKLSEMADDSNFPQILELKKWKRRLFL